jgi:hypothetical protein
VTWDKVFLMHMDYLPDSRDGDGNLMKPADFERRLFRVRTSTKERNPNGNGVGISRPTLFYELCKRN